MNKYSEQKVTQRQTRGSTYVEPLCDVGREFYDRIVDPRQMEDQQLLILSFTDVLKLFDVGREVTNF